MINYETGVSTDPADLLTKLATFLLAHGWDVDAATGGGSIVSSGGSGSIIAGLFAQSTAWVTRGATGINTGLAYDAQPGNSGVSHGMGLGAGPFTAYHFWIGDEDGNEYCHVTVEVSANNFRHWVLGNLVKYGTWNGGTYCDASDPSLDFFALPQPDDTRHRYVCDANNNTIEHAHIWVDYDGKTSPNWQRVRSASAADTNCCVGSHRGQGLFASFAYALDQEWNMRTPLVPCVYFAKRAAFLISPIGRIPNMRFVTMNNFVPGQIVTYGSDDWMIFPEFVRYSTFPGNGILSSGVYGIAHRMP